jgi:hypothetical protein
MKIATIRDKESLKKMEEFLFKIPEKRKAVIDKL